MSTIYIVQASWGMYSDEEKLLIKAFRDKDKADELSEKAYEHAFNFRWRKGPKFLKEEREEFIDWHDYQGKSPYLPEDLDIHDDPSFEVIEVELDES